MTLLQRNALPLRWSSAGFSSGKVVLFDRRKAKPPSVAPQSGVEFPDCAGLDRLLRRLCEQLDADRVVAVQSSVNNRAEVIGLTEDVPRPDTLERYLAWCTNCPRQLADLALQPEAEDGNPAVLLDQDSTNGDSVLIFPVPVAGNGAITVVAVRAAVRPPFTGNEQRTLLRLAPWVEDALTMWSQMHRFRQQSTGLQATLDQAGVAMIMLDRDAYVIGGNRAARALLASGDGLLISGAKLTAAALDDAVKLHSTIGHVMIGAATELGTLVLAIRRSSRRPLMLTVLRVAVAPRAGETAVVLQVTDPELDRGAATVAVCAMFRLTGAETRLATLLAAGHSLAEAATMLRVQLPTARAYLKQAFDKTGTNRQAALVHLLMSSLAQPAPGIALRVV